MRGRRAKGRAKPRVTRALVGSGLATGIIATGQLPASACEHSYDAGSYRAPNGNTYELWYAWQGQESVPTTYDGVLGDINKAPNSNVPNTQAEHLLEWLGVQDNNASSIYDCAHYGNGACWMQTGFALGNVGGNITTTQKPYEEEVPPDGAYFSWFPPDGNATTIGFKVVPDGVNDSFGYPEFDSWEVVNGNSVDVSTSSLPVQYQSIYALSEYVSNDGIGTGYPDCIVQTTGSNKDYFGADSSGTVSSSTQLENEGNGFTWGAWTGNIQAVNSGDQGHYSRSIMDDFYAFHTSGP